MKYVPTRLFLTIVGVASCIFAVGCSGNVSDENVVRIDPNEAYKRMKDNTLVLDTRQQADYDIGHLPSARLVQLKDVSVDSGAEDEKPRFSGYSWIIVYGQNPGTASAKAMAKRLLITKHKNVRWMEAGFDEWVRLGLPVEITETMIPSE